MKKLNYNKLVFGLWSFLALFVVLLETFFLFNFLVGWKDFSWGVWIQGWIVLILVLYCLFDMNSD